MNGLYKEISDLHKGVPLNEIPVLDYNVFYNLTFNLLSNESNHCLTYFAYPKEGKLRFLCCIGNDERKTVILYSHVCDFTDNIVIASLTEKINQFHVFEREIKENYGVEFVGHPWSKPLRYAEDRHDKSQMPDNYPFYSIGGNELHEVGVGPVHAGIIEPGYFRFICNGENVLHLEIRLGYQHRGVEKLMVGNKNALQRIVMAEGIAGDTTIGHSLCSAFLLETLTEKHVNERLMLERAVALEMERIAVHIGDTAALCTDIGYQFGQVVNEALRTMVINTMLHWCGNRFGKGLIRPFGSYLPLTSDIINVILKNLADVEKRYLNIADRIFTLPGVLARFEGVGKVSADQARQIGAVGMAARSSGLKRDIRWSHPSSAYIKLNYEPLVFQNGDVWARAMLRKIEIEKSLNMIRSLVSDLSSSATENLTPDYTFTMQPDTFAVSLVEGWRGEICHAAVTDNEGKIIVYKIKDPSFHNWTALALAVRGQEISDFPLCNKSYNLSYCGNDL